MAQNLEAKKLNFLSKFVNSSEKLLEAVDELKAARTEWTEQGYSSGIVEADIKGNLVHLTTGILSDAIGSIDALDTLLKEGHLAKLYKMKS